MVKCIIVKYRKFQFFMKIRAFYYLNPLGKVFTKKQIDAFAVPISLQLKEVSNKTYHSTSYLSEKVLHTHLIWYSSSTYVDNGTTKVPISAEIGFCIQVSTSEIWN